MTIDLATEDDSLVEGPEDYAALDHRGGRAEHDGCRRGGQRHGVHGDDDDHGQRRGATWSLTGPAGVSEGGDGHVHAGVGRYVAGRGDGPRWTWR